MSKTNFQEQFMATKGKPIIYQGKELIMADRVNLPDKISNIRITFLSTKSDWKQGICLDTKGKFIIEGEVVPKATVLWEYTAPKVVEMSVESKDKQLLVWNSWGKEDGTTHYWHNGGAMYAERLENETIYHCNDGIADDDFDDLVFKLEIL